MSLMVSDFFFFKQKTAYEMRISDWSSDVCSSDLLLKDAPRQCAGERAQIIVVAAASNRREPGQARCARHADIVARGPCVCLCGEKLGIVLDRDRDGLGRRSGQPRQGRRLLEVARGQAAAETGSVCWWERAGTYVSVSWGTGPIKKKKNDNTK